MLVPRSRQLIAAFFFGSISCIGNTAPKLDYHEIVVNGPPALTVRVSPFDATHAVVTIVGSDTRRPTKPFTVKWGDGKSSEGFFPLTHTYRDRARNYVILLTAHYSGRATASASHLVRFVSPVLASTSSGVASTVSIPRTMPEISVTDSNHHLPQVEPFPDSAFQMYSREVFRRVMDEIAAIQRELVNENVSEAEGPFRQMLMAQSEAAPFYAFSAWYTRPAILVTKPGVLRGTPDWSSIAHEMGHNITLNSPKSCRLGHEVEGPANAIVTETLAQIVQHVTAFELVNHAAEHGISDDLAEEIAESALGSFSSLKIRTQGARFSSWNNQATAADETLPTFMTLAYRFLEACDLEGVSYSAATKRLMFFLQQWTPVWKKRFSPQKNSSEAETFRSSLMVAAVSFGVGHDLRGQFRTLGFPIDDAVFSELTKEVGTGPDFKL